MNRHRISLHRISLPDTGFRHLNRHRVSLRARMMNRHRISTPEPTPDFDTACSWPILGSRRALTLCRSWNIVFSDWSARISVSSSISPIGLDLITFRIEQREKGTSLNSDSLAPRPVASSVYVRVPEGPSPSQTVDISDVPFSLLEDGLGRSVAECLWSVCRGCPARSAGPTFLFTWSYLESFWRYP